MTLEDEIVLDLQKSILVLLEAHRGQFFNPYECRFRRDYLEVVIRKLILRISVIPTPDATILVILDPISGNCFDVNIADPNYKTKTIEFLKNEFNKASKGSSLAFSGPT